MGSLGLAPDENTRPMKYRDIILNSWRMIGELKAESWHLDSTPDPVGCTANFTTKNDCFQLKVGDLGVHCC